jgi:hypothetical protein
VKKIKNLWGKIGKKTMVILFANVFLAAFIRCMVDGSPRENFSSIYFALSVIIIAAAAFPALDNFIDLNKRETKA